MFYTNTVGSVALWNKVSYGGILEQFIGLIDKNDVEIYEHDIVRIGDGRLYAIMWDVCGFSMVQIHSTRSEMDGKKYFGNILSYKGKAYMFVVGNLHEKKYMI